MKQTVDYLIVGAGMTGLAFANFVEAEADFLILEKENEIGGWCKTIKQDGFVWDFSGHFFHFRNPEIEDYLRQRMSGKIVKVEKNSKIYFKGSWIDFPFQKNIHQLPKEDFVDCLYDLYFKKEFSNHASEGSFKAMLYEKFGRGIAEKFLIPYNEKLYACDVEELDSQAMGRFFPDADLESIIRNMRKPDNASYNASFTYPEGGAIMYVNALKSEVPDDKILLNSELLSVDFENKIARTTCGKEIAYGHLVSSAPFHQFVNMIDLEGLGFSETEPIHDALSYNKVLCFNLGFDKKGLEDVHWVYYPEEQYSFYRIGFYDNIMGSDRMSLYVELGYGPEVEVNVEAAREKVLQDLKAAGIFTGDQSLVSHHHVILDPAYVHINEASRDWFSRITKKFEEHQIHSIGRYGGWTYCSIEDNIIEAKALSAKLQQE